MTHCWHDIKILLFGSTGRKEEEARGGVIIRGRKGKAINRRTRKLTGLLGCLPPPIFSPDPSSSARPVAETFTRPLFSLLLFFILFPDSRFLPPPRRYILQRGSSSRGRTRGGNSGCTNHFGVWESSFYWHAIDTTCCVGDFDFLWYMMIRGVSSEWFFLNRKIIDVTSFYNWIQFWNSDQQVL